MPYRGVLQNSPGFHFAVIVGKIGINILSEERKGTYYERVAGRKAGMSKLLNWRLYIFIR